MYSVLLICYTLTMFLLFRTLRRLSKERMDVKSTRNEVLAQFSVFLLAFLIKLLVQAITLASDVDYTESIFLLSVSEVMQHYFLNFLPVFFMLVCHHRSFRTNVETSLRMSEL